MSDETVSALIPLKRVFHDLEQQLAELTDTMPTGAALVAGEAEVTDEQRVEAARLRAAMAETADAIQQRVAEVPPGDRAKVDEAATRAARAGS